MYKKIYNIFFILVLIIAGVIYFKSNNDNLELLLKISYKQLLLLSFIIILFFYISGQLFNLTLQLYKYKLTFNETIGLSVIGNFGSYIAPIIPGAGSLFKAIYLKKTKKIEFSIFSACFMASFLINLWVLGLIGLITLFYSQYNSTSFILIFICSCIIIFPIFLLFIKLPNIKKTNRILKFINSIFEAFKIIRNNKNKIIEISFWYFLQTLFAAIIFYYTFLFLGSTLTFFNSFFISVFLSLANTFSITPNGIGVQELIMAFIFMKTGYNFSVGLMGASIIRIIHIIVTFALTPIFYIILFKPYGIKFKL